MKLCRIQIACKLKDCVIIIFLNSWTINNSSYSFKDPNMRVEPFKQGTSENYCQLIQVDRWD